MAKKNVVYRRGGRAIRELIWKRKFRDDDKVYVATGEYYTPYVLQVRIEVFNNMTQR